MHTDSMRHLARIYLPPISWVHPLLPFVGHAVSRHDLAPIGREQLVKFHFLLPPLSPRASHAAKYVDVYRRIIHGT